MKMLFIGSIVFLSVSCVNKAGKVADAVGPDTVRSAMATYTDTAWYADFRDLQDAFVKGDSSRVKKYFTFPIHSDENIIWALSGAAYHPPVDDKTGEQMQIAFRDVDFDKYHRVIFPEQFVEGLSRVKVNDLEPGTVIDHELSGNDSVHYSFMASLDSAGTALQFVLTTRYSMHPDQKPEDEDDELSLVGYTFSILSGKTIRFREVALGD